MLKKIVLLAAICMTAQYVSAQVAYKLFNKKGQEVSIAKMAKDVSKSDVILFGEQHTDPIGHWIQLKTTQAIFEKTGKLSMGAEMFESDNQLLINEYFSGIIRTKDFEKEARLWDNYATDYKPLVEFANSNKLKFTATNIPRRYAAVVNKKGLEGLDELSEEAKKLIMPLPMVVDSTNPSYVKMMEMDFGHGKGGPGALKMAKAQAVKDATMAHFIGENLENKTPFIHFQGDFHSAHYGGVYWYLKYWNPKLNVVTISTVYATGELEFKEEYAAISDFILVVTEDMTQTNR
jgi:uncharacterized iron-regulated protein